MLKIGEFSKLSHLTVKALRFYEKEGLLLPAATDPWTGYRLYDSSQLMLAARIKAYRQLELSIEDIRLIILGQEEARILAEKERSLKEEQSHINALLSSLHHILEDKSMKYPVTEKVIPKTLVYYSEATLAHYDDMMTWIPSLGEAALKLNPELRCQEPPYEFCEYLDGEYREENIRIRHNEAVTKRGKESELIRFRELPETKVLSIYHQGPYDTLPEAYAYLMAYAKERGYECAGPARECYIDGIWNKEDPAEWLTEVQLPIKP